MAGGPDSLGAESLYSYIGNWHGGCSRLAPWALAVWGGGCLGGCWGETQLHLPQPNCRWPGLPGCRILIWLHRKLARALSRFGTGALAVWRRGRCWWGVGGVGGIQTRAPNQMAGGPDSLGAESIHSYIENWHGGFGRLAPWGGGGGVFG